MNTEGLLASKGAKPRASRIDFVLYKVWYELSTLTGSGSAV